MEFDQIMRKITAGLCGDQKKDMQYLKDQCEAYKEHALATEIIRACSRMMFELIPEESKEEIERVLGNDKKGIDATLDEIRFLMQKKDLVKAEKLSRAMVKQADDMPMFQNDSVSEYYTFREFFEEVLFQELNDVERDVRRTDYPFSEIYLLHGSLMMEMKNYEEARCALEKARRWNPVNCDIAFEYMETYKAAGDMEHFYQLTVDMMRYIFSYKDLGRALRNLGYYFTEKELYAVASGCYVISLEYDEESKNAQSELYYIQSKCNGTLPKPSMEEIEKYSETYGFPIRINQEVLGVAFGVGRQFLANGNEEAAEYLFSIVKNLIGEESFAQIWDELQ